MTCHPARPDRLTQERNRQMWAAAWTGAVQGAVAGARGAPAPAAQVRIGDAERESAVTALGDHYAAGRITKEEFDDRSGTAWSARTSGDLVPLFTDLPRLQTPPPRRPRPSQASRRPGFALWWVFTLVLVLAMTGQVPWVAVAVFAGLWWAGILPRLHSWAHRGRAEPRD
jgi:hypothetical protein